jgi:hypothetical protein
VFLRGRPSEPGAPVDRERAPRRALYVAAAYVVVAGIFWTAYQIGLGPVSR